MWVKCPQCGKPAEWQKDNSNRPFCSARCKLLDLGEWAAGNRYIAGEPTDGTQAPERRDSFEPSDDF